jgi:hypothetical protein
LDWQRECARHLANPHAPHAQAECQRETEQSPAESCVGAEALGAKLAREHQSIDSKGDVGGRFARRQASLCYIR